MTKGAVDEVLGEWLLPNDYEEVRKLVYPRPEEIANSDKLEVFGRTVIVLCVSVNPGLRGWEFCTICPFFANFSLSQESLKFLHFSLKLP